ncbi:hypothetical protein MsAg5_16380 [Methanosarcinaceae archaeon Ag5]|uniref:Replication factor A n=1 Tax=Methanolapillus africanus TaxID=3028297 RepID=A0AAE4MKV0_9EURY|nr:hypothetical protein [Methanosarcinaceae archaeon Ag5]
MTNMTEKSEKIEKRKRSETKSEHIVAETFEKYDITEQAETEMNTEPSEHKPDNASYEQAGGQTEGTGTTEADLMADAVSRILKNFAGKNIELSRDEVFEKLQELVLVYKVPPHEAERTVSNIYVKRHKLAKSDVSTGRGAKTMKIDEILKTGTNESANTEALWVSLDGKVIQLWENPHESIAQVGLIGDETGVTKFTLWGNAGLPALELNKSYQFKNAIVKTWNNKAQIELNKATNVSVSERDVQVLPLENTAAGDKQKNNEIRKVEELNKDGVWTDIYAKVVQVFDKTHDSITVAGILGDETGTIRFTMWKTAECEAVEIDKSYLFTNVIVKEWNGKYAVELNKNSRTEELDEEVFVKSSAVEMTGCAVDIQAGSGLVKRCPDCNKVLSKGICSEHGKVKGKYDLRIKAVIDDGKTAQESIINCALTEQILKMTLDDAIAIATETLDPESIADLIKRDFLGKYYTVTGAKTDRYIIVETIEPAKPVDLVAVAQLKSRIELERLEYELFGNKIDNNDDGVHETTAGYPEVNSDDAVDFTDVGADTNIENDAIDFADISKSTSGLRMSLDSERKLESDDIGFEFESVAKGVI